MRARRYAWLRHHGLPQLLGLPPATSMRSSNSSSTPTLPLPAVSELFDFFATRVSLNLFLKFFRFRQVLHVTVKPVGATDSDSDDDDE